MGIGIIHLLGGTITKKAIIRATTDEKSEFERCELTTGNSNTQCLTATCWDCSNNKGKAKIKNDVLYIGMSKNKITSYPTFTCGRWFMTLGEEEYYKEDYATCTDGIQNRDETSNIVVAVGVLLVQIVMMAF